MLVSFNPEPVCSSCSRESQKGPLYRILLIQKSTWLDMVDDSWSTCRDASIWFARWISVPIFTWLSRSDISYDIISTTATTLLQSSGSLKKALLVWNPICPTATYSEMPLPLKIHTLTCFSANNCLTCLLLIGSHCFHHYLLEQKVS